MTLFLALQAALHWLTPAGAALLAFGLFGIDEVGIEIEEPFGYDPNDLPLDLILKGVDQDTREILGTSSSAPAFG